MSVSSFKGGVVGLGLIAVGFALAAATFWWSVLDARSSAQEEMLVEMRALRSELTSILKELRRGVSDRPSHRPFITSVDPGASKVPTAQSGREDPAVDQVATIEGRFDDLDAKLVEAAGSELALTTAKRVPKQWEEVDSLSEVAQGHYREATALVFGWSTSQIYRNYGQPDSVEIDKRDHTMRWIYADSAQNRWLTIVFADGVVIGVDSSSQ